MMQKEIKQKPNPWLEGKQELRAKLLPLRQIGIRARPSLDLMADEGSSGAIPAAIEQRFEKVEQRVERIKRRLDGINESLRNITQMINAMNIGREQETRNRRPNKQAITDSEEEEQIGRQNPGIAERRNKAFQRKSEAGNSQREQYEGIDHEMKAGEKIPQADAPIFQEGDEVVDFLKATNVQVEEPVLQINQGMEDFERDCRLVVEQHVFDIEHKVEMLGQEETAGNLVFTGKDLFSFAGKDLFSFAGKDLFSLFYNQILDEFDADKHNQMLLLKLCNCAIPMDVLLCTSHVYGGKFCERTTKLIFSSTNLYLWQTILLRQYKREGLKKIYVFGVYQNHRKKESCSKG
ncbi:hypothetical protein FNV43_RR10298 [Rhamnella rubrinervis]|uniref:Uncharacterized protein n=1 Tax=Rhamnella rubrinervis TaxID=2594499 RepID=A0A8K0MKM2_9ROSA|nr:hypothetical protein FNV43_RR10298 [Rhamnella rubrinervis]